MWLKNSEGELINLDTGAVIKAMDGVVVLELPQRDYTSFYLMQSKDCYRLKEHFENPLQFEYKFIETHFENGDAQTYIDKLAEKLGALEV